MRSALGNIEDLGDGRFRIRTTAGYNHATGKRVRPSKVIRGSRRDANRELALMLMRSGNGDAGSLTVTGFLEDVWLPTKDQRRRRTVTNYASKIRACITPHIGHLHLDDLTPYVVERWLSDLRKGGLSPQSVKHARAVLKNGMRAAVRWNLIDRDPTDGSEIPDVDYQPTVLTGEQMNAYLDAFAGHVIEPIVILSIALGTRRSETCALDWSDIDFDNATVMISKGLHQENSDVWVEDPKSRTSKRLLALPPWAIDALRPLRGVGPLAPDLEGRMAPQKVARLYKAHVIDRKLPYVPLRDLRNSLGTWLYDSGVELGRIADQFGHSSTEITRKHYVVRSHKQANHATAAVVQSLREGQNGPNTRDTGGQHPRESENGPSAEVAQAH